MNRVLKKGFGQPNSETYQKSFRNANNGRETCLVFGMVGGRVLNIQPEEGCTRCCFMSARAELRLMFACNGFTIWAHTGRHVWQAVQVELQDKEYDGEEAKEWSLNIADTIREGVKTLNVPR